MPAAQDLLIYFSMLSLYSTAQIYYIANWREAEHLEEDQQRSHKGGGREVRVLYFFYIPISSHDICGEFWTDPGCPPRQCQIVYLSGPTIGRQCVRFCSMIPLFPHTNEKRSTCHTSFPLAETTARTKESVKRETHRKSKSHGDCLKPEVQQVQSAVK